MQRYLFVEESVLLQQVAAGDEQAFAVLIGRYWNNVHAQTLAYIKSTHQAQDIVQEIFIRIWEKRQQLLHIERFDAFLYIVARNHIISELRKKVVLPLPHDFLDISQQDSALPDQPLLVKQLQQQLTTAIETLPPQQRTAYLLSRDEGLTFDTIAARMGISRETVKKHIGRALNSIRSFVSKHADTLCLLLICSGSHH